VENNKLTPADALKLIENHKNSDDLMLLDVRTPWEYSEESVPGAINLDFTDPDFIDMIKELDMNKTYIVYCKTGKRSEMVKEIMIDHGFKKVYSVLNGFEGIKEEISYRNITP
jgi:phage shock protein E